MRVRGGGVELPGVGVLVHLGEPVGDAADRFGHRVVPGPSELAVVPALCRALADLQGCYPVSVDVGDGEDPGFSGAAGVGVGGYVVVHGQGFGEQEVLVGERGDGQVVDPGLIDQGGPGEVAVFVQFEVLAPVGDVGLAAAELVPQRWDCLHSPFQVWEWIESPW